MATVQVPEEEQAAYLHWLLTGEEAPPSAIAQADLICLPVYMSRFVSLAAIGMITCVGGTEQVKQDPNQSLTMMEELIGWLQAAKEAPSYDR